MTNRNPRHPFLGLVLTGLLLGAGQSAHAQAKPAAEGKAVLAIEKVEPTTAGLGDTLAVTVKGWPKEKPAPRDWVVYLDGVALPGVHPDNTDAREGVFRFSLRRDDRSKAAWATLLRGWRFERPVAVAVGPESGPENAIAALTTGFRLVVIPWAAFWGYLLLLLVLLGLLLLLGSKSTMLRDSDTVPPAGCKRPFSLGRVQMAFWFVLIWASYLYIGLVTWDYGQTMSGTALVLMGISAATGFGAVLIDAGKQQQTQALQAEHAVLPGQVAQLQQAVTAGAAAPANPVATANLVTMTNELQRKQTRQNEVATLLAQQLPALTLGSGGLIDDLLRDSNGTSLHRFQIVVWTLTLGAVFVGSVIVNLAMPVFDPTLLTLMGISSGTYLGFKFPERKA